MNADHLERLVGTLGGTTLKERRDRALVLLLLSSGARVSELLRLDRRDWSHNRLMLRGKGSRKRTVVVTSSARKAVDEYLQARGKLGDPSTALFIGFQPALTRASSKRLSATGGRHVLQAISRRAGIPPFHPHRLRDTFGSIVQRETGDPCFTAATLGYADLRSIAGYLPKPADRRQSARKALEAAGL
jgi:site-specific recombinase XerD